MSCDKPTGDCTNVSPCSDCGCGGSTTPEPVLPRCNNALPDGVFPFATVTVANGCIAAIAEGDPPVYVPDDCCGGGGGSGTGGSGARGPKGDDGAAATIEVDPVVATGTAWSVENTGTSSAAVLKFTAPAATGGGSSTTTGFTGEVSGVKVQAGLVKEMPASLVTGIQTTFPTPADWGTLTASPWIDDPDQFLITLEMAGAKTYVDNAVAGLQDQIDALSEVVADLAERVESLEGGDTSAVSAFFFVDPVTGIAYNPGTQSVTAITKHPNTNADVDVVVPAGGIAQLPIYDTAGTQLLRTVTINGVGVGIYDAGSQGPGGS